MKNDAVLWSRCLKHVMDETGEKPQTKCRRHMLVRARKIWPMHCRSCAGLFLCFYHFILTCSVCYRLLCLKCETWKWNLRPCNERCMLVRTEEKWPTGHGRCADLFVLFFVLFSDMFRVLAVKQCSCEQREMRRETLWQALHEKDAETNAWIQNLHEVVHGKICEWETLPNLIPCRIHLACCCVMLLWRNCVLKKMKMIRWSHKRKHKLDQQSACEVTWWQERLPIRMMLRTFVSSYMCQCVLELRNIVYAGDILRQRIVNMREMENRSPEDLCVKRGSHFEIQDIPDWSIMRVTSCAHGGKQSAYMWMSIWQIAFM